MPFKNSILWFFNALYVLALPYAIWVFDLLLQVVSLSVVKQIPTLVMLFLIVLYLFICLKRKQGFYFLHFILPCSFLLMMVFFLEPNRIKHSHIPEYMLLFYLIVMANANRKGQSLVYFGCFISTVLLGVFDEVHHGIHPSRYYGWKDMFINAVGAFMGLLLLLQLRPMQDSFRTRLVSMVCRYKYSLGILVLNFAVVTFSCLKLFLVQDTGMFVVYSQAALRLNFLSIILSSFYCVFQFHSCKGRDEYRVLIYQPLFITYLIQILIVYVCLHGFAFK